jgi:hypothetical protein
MSLSEVKILLLRSVGLKHFGETKLLASTSCGWKATQAEHGSRRDRKVGRHPEELGMRNVPRIGTELKKQ